MLFYLTVNFPTRKFFKISFCLTWLMLWYPKKDILFFHFWKDEDQLANPRTALLKHQSRSGATSAKSGATSSSIRSVADASQHHVLYLDRSVISQPDNADMQQEMEVRFWCFFLFNLHLFPVQIYPWLFSSYDWKTFETTKEEHS